METGADRDDLRFRLDWPEGDLNAPGDEAADFSFEWDQKLTDTALVEAGEPQPSEFGATEPADESPPVPEVYDAPPLYDEFDSLEVIRRVLDEHNDALVQLSDAVYELATNVRTLVEQRNGPPSEIVSGPTETDSVTATAIITMTAEVSEAMDELRHTRSEIQAVLSEMQLAGTESSPVARLGVEIERLHAEVQALKRRIPVRSKDVDADEIAQKVAQELMAILATTRPATTRGAATPEVKARRRLKAEPIEEAPPARPLTSKKQRPLRAD